MAEQRFVSTRGHAPAVTLSETIARGLAPDGGLYVPERLPPVDVAALSGLSRLPDLARIVLAGFFAGDPLQPHLGAIAEAALGLDAPTTAVAGCADPLFVLELFHGPTAAFKDFGARFLGETLQRMEQGGAAPLTILVATSGDTGGAVAAAFHRRPWVKVVILYPHGLVSPRQEQQLTCWDDNVTSLRVEGTFDDCQHLVKEAFLDARLNASHRFSSANSINIGRLLPQMIYYAASSLDIKRRTGQAASYIIPAGNLGNAFAAVWARALGLPIARIVLAHNANRSVPDFLESGVWRPRAAIATLASAMDVGNPSNMERMRAFYGTTDELRADLRAESVDDAAIRARISDRRRSVCAPARRATPRSALGTGRHRPPGEIQRSGRTAARQTRRRTGEPRAVVASAAPLYRDCRVARRPGSRASMNDFRIDPQWIWMSTAVAVLAAAGTAGVRSYQRRARRRALLARLDRVAYEAVHQVQVPDGMGGYFHIDHLLLTARGLLILDTRRVPGLIFGGDQMSDWTVLARGRRFTFDNPQPALYDRIAAVKALVGEMPVEGRLLFSNLGKFTKGIPKWVLMLDSIEVEFPLVDARVKNSENYAKVQDSWKRLLTQLRPSPHSFTNL
jgi:threonine synthase